MICDIVLSLVEKSVENSCEISWRVWYIEIVSPSRKLSKGKVARRWFECGVCTCKNGNHLKI